MYCGCMSAWDLSTMQFRGPIRPARAVVAWERSNNLAAYDISKKILTASVILGTLSETILSTPSTSPFLFMSAIASLLVLVGYASV